MTSKMTKYVAPSAHFEQSITQKVILGSHLLLDQIVASRERGGNVEIIRYILSIAS